MHKSSSSNVIKRRLISRSLLDKKIAFEAFKQAIVMLRPDLQWRNPVMFVVEIGMILTTLYIFDILWGAQISQAPLSYLITLDVWLLLTLVFANFATALAEARGRAQADSLRHSRPETIAYRLKPSGETEEISSVQLKKGDKVVVKNGQIIPADGEIVYGIAYIDESAITGESAPVVREEGGDRSGVTGGTRVLSDHIIVSITGVRGDSFLDRMISLVEGAIRQRTPNEIAITLVLSFFTLSFLIVVISLWSSSYNAEIYIEKYLDSNNFYLSLGTDVPTLIALLVCLIPTTIGALLAGIGISGMDRALQANIIANSGKVVELAGDVDVILLDKTGTITIGNRSAVEFSPTNNYTQKELAELSALASISDNTPEGKSIYKLYEKNYLQQIKLSEKAIIKPFTAQVRMSGVDLPDGHRIRKGAPDAIIKYVKSQNGAISNEVNILIHKVASRGATPMLVADGDKIAGVIVLEDVLKPLIHERFARLRRMGLRTVMITGDNPLTAAAIAAAAGVDDYIAEATPALKLQYIRNEQAKGKLVAMMGDGTNDAPALAQADVAIAMNAGTEAAKEAANMVDLDSNPTKLLDIIEIGKQLLITRGAVTTFSIANDVAKYFAIIPALFATTLPWLSVVDIMNLHSPTSAILSAIIFNALIIPFLIPIALKGINYFAIGADTLLRRNLLIWGLGGIIAPFIGIKTVDMVMTWFNIF